MTVDIKMKAIDKMLYPKSIAIIGASNNKGKTGGRLLSYILMHNYLGNIYPVNPKDELIQGKKAYKTIKDLPDDVDLALVALPEKMIFEVLEECAKKNIKSLVIFSSGFAEIGEEGEVLQEKLLLRANELGLHICGPNCIGIVSTPQQFFGSFSMSMETPGVPKDGSIAFVSQSGAIGGGILSRAWSEGIGISHFISSGNEADLDSADFINYLTDDDYTEVICVYLEGISDGQKLIQALRKACNAGKPVIIYKNGRTSLGKKSVQSHTGSLAGDFKVYEAVFKQYGVISVNRIDELFEVAKAMITLKEIKGRNIGVISTSGGACTIIADSCLEHGLNVPPFSHSTTKKLKKVIPDFGVVQNPFDTTANIINNPETFYRAMEVLIDDSEIDAIILMLTTVGEPIASEIANDIVKLYKHSEKPIVISWLISSTLAENAFAILKNNNIPIYSSPERAVSLINYVANYYSTKTNFVQRSLFK